MSINVTYNGVTYVIPEVGDTGWGPDVTRYLNALSTGNVTKAGGFFPLEDNLNFGNVWSITAGGLNVLKTDGYVISPNVAASRFIQDVTPVAQSGTIRLAAQGVGSIRWRNQANSGDLTLATNTSNQLTFNGVPLVTSATGGVVWGSITGEITDQEDLTWALDTSAVTAVWSAIEGNINAQTDLMDLFATKANITNTRFSGVGFLYSNGTGLNATFGTTIPVAAGGVPTGGTTGQVLTKSGNGDYALTWANAGSASVAWGAITGTLSNQTDLQNALNLKADLASPTFTGTVSGITKSMVGLGNVDNTSDANKPISTATQAALDLKAPINNPTFTGTVGGITKAMVGLGNVDNTSDVNKPISTATQTALDGKAPIAAANPTGGTTGQVLTKNSATNYDYSWQTPTGGGTTPDILSPFLLMGG